MELEREINNEIEKDCDEMKSFRRSPFLCGDSEYIRLEDYLTNVFIDSI